jgi:hypothetical protein
MNFGPVLENHINYLTMKRLFFCLTIAGLLLSCGKDKELQTDLVRKFQLVEVLLDDGGGNGVFQPVESFKTVTFHSDKSITSMGDLCSMSIEADTSTSGVYSLEDSTISLPNCNKLNFEINGDELIINYPCIEPCRLKYHRTTE